MEGLDRHAILRQLANIFGVYVPSLYVPIYSDDGKFKGYHIAEGAPKTIKRHFEMLTSGGETVVATNYTEFGAMYIIEVARWLWPSLSDSVWLDTASACLVCVLSIF